MEFDNRKIDEAALALLYLTIHDENRAWRSIDWEVMERLHQQGFIFDPKNKAKSVVLTDEGRALSQQVANRLFAKDAAAGSTR